ncbi:MAG TPA: hypothetical protein VFW28_05170 [Micropepsaceae bacterium]|nr:hypothetical protein [Micropepsaceae bacterium]
MNGDDFRAFQYRQRAEELRAILSDMKDPEIRKKIEKLILDYEKLAFIQDKREEP